MMRHFLLTRFNVDGDFESSISRFAERRLRLGAPLGERWLEERVRLFERFCLPSVRRQSCRDFTWLVFFHARTPDWVRKRIESWPEVTPVFLAECAPEAIEAEVKRRAAGASWIITSRLDNDDAIATWFIERLQREFRRRREILNFTAGHVWKHQTVYNVAHRYNPFITFCEPAGSAKTVFSFRHTVAAEYAPVRQIESDPAWMIVCHESNLSNGVDVYARWLRGSLMERSAMDHLAFDPHRPLPGESYYDFVARGWAKDGYEIGRDRWKRVEPLLRPGMRTLETGSGLSTHLFAAANCDHTALEHEPRFAERTRRGLRGATVLTSPLTGSPPWYDVQLDGPFDLLFIDGPQGTVGREGILPRLGKLCHDATVIAVDDANRPAEAKLHKAIASARSMETMLYDVGIAVLKPSRPRPTNGETLGYR